MTDTLFTCKHKSITAAMVFSALILQGLTFGMNFACSSPGSHEDLDAFAQSMAAWELPVHDCRAQGAYNKNCAPPVALPYWHSAQLFMDFLQTGDTVPSFEQTIKFIHTAQIPSLYRPEVGSDIYLGHSDVVYVPDFELVNLDTIGDGGVFKPVLDKDGNIKTSVGTKGQARPFCTQESDAREHPLPATVAAFPNFGDLTGYLFVVDLVYAGLVGMPSVEEVGAMIPILNAGALSALLQPGLMNNDHGDVGRYKVKVADTFVRL
jgi:hypothetical protein